MANDKASSSDLILQAAGCSLQAVRAMDLQLTDVNTVTTNTVTLVIKIPGTCY